MSAFVYVMTSRKTLDVKIGLAGDPRHRLYNVKRKLRDETIRIYDAVLVGDAQLVESIVLNYLHGVCPPPVLYIGEWRRCTPGFALRVIKETEQNLPGFLLANMRARMPIGEFDDLLNLAMRGMYGWA